MDDEVEIIDLGVDMEQFTLFFLQMLLPQNSPVNHVLSVVLDSLVDPALQLTLLEQH